MRSHVTPKMKWTTAYSGIHKHRYMTSPKQVISDVSDSDHRFEYGLPFFWSMKLVLHKHLLETLLIHMS